MINAKGLKELNPKDQEVLLTILAISPGELTEDQRGHLVARREYLEKEDLKRFEIKEKVEEPEANEEDTNEEQADYSAMRKDELVATCKERNIEVAENATKADLVELLEADDKGELEEVKE